MWVSPNILTLASVAVLFVAYIVIDLYDTNFCTCTYKSELFVAIPGWVWVLTSICVFLSHTLDGLDGIHARRLGISTPMGELLDHGCDSVSAYLICMFVLSSLYVCGPDGVSLPRLVANLGSVLFLFYLSHWEKYITGTLFLPWGYDLTFILLTIYMLTLTVVQPLSMFAPFLGKTTMFEFFELLYQVCIWVFSAPVCIYNIYKSYSTGAGRPFREAIRPLFPLLLLNVIFVILLYLQSTATTLHPKYVLWLYGVVSSNIVSRLIVAQMSDSLSPITNPFFIPLAIFAGWLTLEHFAVLNTPTSLQESVLEVIVYCISLAHFYFFASVVGLGVDL